MSNNDIWKKINIVSDDIVIASTVKSGTTWLQQIVAQLIFKGEFEDKLSDVSFWIDTVREYSEEEMCVKINNLKHRRFFKTHSPATVVLRNKNNVAKYIFITRDFRDVVWSFYNHFVNSKYKVLNHSKENKVTLEEATNLIVKKTKNFAKRQYTWFENRFDQNLKIYGEDNLSLVVETFKKII